MGNVQFQQQFWGFHWERKSLKNVQFFGKGKLRSLAKTQNKTKTQKPQIVLVCGQNVFSFWLPETKHFSVFAFSMKTPKLLQKNVKISFCFHWLSLIGTETISGFTFFLCGWVRVWPWDCDTSFVSSLCLSTWAAAFSLPGLVPPTMAACPSLAVHGQVWASPAKYFGPSASRDVSSIWGWQAYCRSSWASCRIWPSVKLPSSWQGILDYATPLGFLIVIFQPCFPPTVPGITPVLVCVFCIAVFQLGYTPLKTITSCGRSS